jgi:hypothetical protein
MMEENKDMKEVGGQKFGYSDSVKPTFPADMMARREISNDDNRRGVGLAIISRGTVPIKWMTHMKQVTSCFPGGLFWKYLIVERMSWAAARNECVRKCRANNFQWIFFIDDDVFVPIHALDKLLRSEKDIVSGIYWTKTENPAPVIFKEMGKGPIYNFNPDEIIPIGGSGAGCLLINMKVFDKFDEAGIPYFVENWVYTDKQGNKMKCPIGEDHYFFMKAKELGFQAYADTSVLCDHYDSKKDKFYPGEKIVKQYCKQKLTQEGRKDLVESYDLHERDPNKQTIVFYNNNVPFAGDELYRRGVGGSETDIINLARDLSLTGKYNVRVYCKCNREGTYDNVIYKNNTKLLEDLPNLNCDLFVASRNLELFMRPDFKKKNNIKQTVLWAHDLATDPMWKGFYDALPNIDKVVVLSEFHKHNVRMKFPELKEEDVIIIRNGVDLHRYKEKVERKKGKCIYSSTPYRGLDVLLKVWPKIKKRVPHAELSIFSSIKVYAEFFDDSPWEDLYNLAKRLEGVHYHGTVKQDRLAKEQMSSQLLLYPNVFPETCCVTAMENQTAGTPIISTKMGALPEVVGQDCGILLEGEPHSKEYQDAFVEAAVDLLTDDEKWEKAHKACLKNNFSWKDLAKQWVDTFLKRNEVGITNKERDNKIIDTDFTVVKEALKMLETSKDFLELSKEHRAWQVNCGSGELAIKLKEKYPDWEVWGSDTSLKALDQCRQRNKKVLFANHPLENPDFEEGYFDYIVCLDPDFEDLDLMIKRLKRGGMIILKVESMDKISLQFNKLKFKLMKDSPDEKGYLWMAKKEL